VPGPPLTQSWPDEPLQPDKGTPSFPGVEATALLNTEGPTHNTGCPSSAWTTFDWLDGFLLPDKGTPSFPGVEATATPSSPANT
jgi:hypothetical protein